MSDIHSCLEVYRERKDWDSAFELLAQFGTESDLDGLVRDALDLLLRSGRLATVDTWVRHASSKGMSSPYLTWAEAELNMRRGQLSVAETLIHRVLDKSGTDPDLQFRALKLAGQVAHLDSRETDGLEYFARAEAAAQDDQSKRDARWGLLIGMAALERAEARELLDQLASDTRVDDPQERIRLAGRRLSMAMRFGDQPPIEQARQVEQLLELVSDPTARCSYRSVYSSALVLGAHYRDAYRVSEELIGDAGDNHVDFGLTYGHAVKAASLAGLRRFEDAHNALDSALEAARRCTDSVGGQNVYATRVRILIQENRFAEACALEPPDLGNSLPGIRGEVLASRGLALASIGRAADAVRLAEDAAGTTQSLEGAVLGAAIHAVLGVRARADSAFDVAETLLDTAVQRGGLDLFVTCYRGNLGVLRLLLASNRTSERALFVLARADDEHLAREVGSPSDVVFDPFAKLTNREREVCALLCEGLTDREIGRLLFITPETAKRHALRILQKTGFKSRRALALAARKPLDQAAPTATFGDAETSAVS